LSAVSLASAIGVFWCDRRRAKKALKAADEDVEAVGWFYRTSYIFAMKVAGDVETEHSDVFNFTLFDFKRHRAARCESSY
jgi:hypothetical protein